MICLSQPETELHCSAMECDTREEVIDLSVISASDEDLAWMPHTFTLISQSDGYVSGTVASEEELGTLLENLTRASSTSFNSWSYHKKDLSKRRLLWQVEDYAENVPLCVEKRTILVCQHGKAPKRRSKMEEQPSEHVKRRRSRERNEKVDCPAKIFIRHVRRYDTFSVAQDPSRVKKEEAMSKLKEALSKTSPTSSTFIHVKFPVAGAHENHSVNSGSSLSRKIHPEVRTKIHDYVALGVTSVPSIKRALKQFVSTELCGQDTCKPHEGDKAYFPTEHTIGNYVYLAKGNFNSELHLKTLERSEDHMGQHEDTSEQEDITRVDEDSHNTMKLEAKMEQSEEDAREKLVTAARAALREEVDKLMNASYLCADIESLLKVSVAVADIAQSFINPRPQRNKGKSKNPAALSTRTKGAAKRKTKGSQKQKTVVVQRFA